MHEELRWPPLSQRRQEARQIMFYKIISAWNCLSFAEVPSLAELDQVVYTFLCIPSA